jgi:pyruvate kinase
MPRTKIVCTLGPASETEETLRAMLRAGMDVARLNFSHGTHEDHARRMALVRRLAKEEGKVIAILQDLQGPKLRIGRLVGGRATLREGDPFTLITLPVIGDDKHVSAPHRDLPRDAKPGDRILLDDGLIELRVEETTATEVRCRVVVGGVLGEHKGVLLPGVQISLPSLTEKDKTDLVFGLESDVDYVAISFVRRASDVVELREFMRQHGKEVPIIAKIEKGEALAAFDPLGEFMDRQVTRVDRGILAVADGVMVARGDLGIETPIDQLPMWQKFIIHKANRASKPVITATQMLESMIHRPRPTRAEATDIANAIFGGTDAVMLSGETAAGQYPVESVQMMARIASTAEERFPHQEWLRRGEHETAAPVTEAISRATVEIAAKVRARAIITPTESGYTARTIARHRPAVPIIAVTYVEPTYRRLALTWGVIPFLTDRFTTSEEMIRRAIGAATAAGRVRSDDRVVITAGLPVGQAGQTNMIQVQEVGIVGT